MTSDATWRLAIVDECVRRLMGGMRDWAPLLSQTRDGMAVLARIAGLRNRLLELADALDRPAPSKDTAQVLSRIQHECRLLALGLELGSGVPLGRQRPGVWTPEALHLYQDDAPTSFVSCWDPYRRLGIQRPSGIATSVPFEVSAAASAMRRHVAAAMAVPPRSE